MLHFIALEKQKVDKRVSDKTLDGDEDGCVNILCISNQTVMSVSVVEG